MGGNMNNSKTKDSLVSEQEKDNEVLQTDSSKDAVNADIVRLYLKDIAKYPILTAEEEKELTKRAFYGDIEAKKKLIHSNLKLVAAIAKNYMNRGLSYLDLIQEGNLGLMRGIDKFDPSRNCKVGTYIPIWIKQSITRAIQEQSRTIRIPINKSEAISKFYNIRCLLTNKLNRLPTTKEIADEMNLSFDLVNEILMANHSIVSLSSSFYQDSNDQCLDDILVYDIIEDDSAINPEQCFDSKCLTNDIHTLIQDCGNIREKELQVLKYRYGFYDGRIYTLEEVAEIMGITRGGVSYIEHHTLDKLRKNNNLDKLVYYMDTPEQALDNLKCYRKKYYEGLNKK